MQRSGHSGPMASLSSTSSRRGRPRRSASQRSPAGDGPVSAQRNSTSMRPPVARWKKLRAGKTRVSLRTSTSPSRSSDGSSEKTRSSSAPVARRTTSRRDASRGSAGRLRDQLVGQLVLEVGQA